jgi:propionate CoA-transferase
MEEEAVIGEVLPIAQAARNCGGVVLAQVKRLRDEPLPPQRVKVPGLLVDRIVVAQDGEHDQTFGERLNAAYCSAGGAFAAGLEPLAWSERRVIAERACDELRPGDVANLGIGMPEGVAWVAAARGLLDRVTLTLESGPIGGWAEFRGGGASGSDSGPAGAV